MAAGNGTRAPGSIPKQYRLLGNKPVLRYAVEVFSRHPHISKVFVVINPDHAAFYATAMQAMDSAEPIWGGTTRQESVRLGLEAIAASGVDVDFVLIHDGARPFVRPKTVDAVLAALETHSAAIPGLALVDTLRTLGPARENCTPESTRILDRSHTIATQTPQGFHFKTILAAHRAGVEACVTDDAAIAEHAGIPVAVVPGDPQNIKLTTEDDFMHADRYLAHAVETRIGQGFDVHRLLARDGTHGNAGTVRLCGVDIPHTHYLEGHSDADVGLHALVDAVLGALGEGDIGEHFPPSDARWKGTDSIEFLKYSVELLAKRGGSIVNLDITLLCEMPKITPYKDRMRLRIAESAGCDVSRVNIKATTTEKLGFMGRGEGIAAQAIATIKLPLA